MAHNLRASASISRHGMRRTHLCGHTNILKRLLIHAGGFNLGLVMRHLIGRGTPRGLQDRPAIVIDALWMLLGAPRRWLVTISAWRPLIAAVRWFPSPITTIATSQPRPLSPRPDKHLGHALVEPSHPSRPICKPLVIRHGSNRQLSGSCQSF